jgi:Methane oxygenase PmoA
MVTRLLSATSLFLTTALLATAEAPPSAVQIVHDPAAKKVTVTVGGQPFTELVYNQFAKPILWPVHGATGAPMTRDWPMKEGTPGEELDHIHQKSLFFMHGDVDGVDFWSEKPGQTGAKIETTSITEAALKDGVAVIRFKNSWIDVSGVTHCTDTRTLECGVDGSARFIDYTTVMEASQGKDVTFGDTKEGTMGLRTRVELQLNEDKNPAAVGHCVNSEGTKGKKIWGEKARWVDYWAPVGEKTLGVAILDHPSNLRHPTTWHARDYGLVSANPFGLHDFSEKWPTGRLAKNTGQFVLKAGQTQSFRYRFHFHEGNAEKAAIEALWKSWSAKP